MASSWAEKSMRDNPDFLLAYAFPLLAMRSPGGLSKHSEAWARALECSPGLGASSLRDVSIISPSGGPAATFAKGLREAGLPE